MTTLVDLIRHDQPLVTGANAVYAYRAMTERKYRFISRFGEVVPLCHRVGDFLYLPRALCPVADIDKRVDGDKVIFEKCPTPRPNQVEMFAEVEQMISKQQSGIVCAYTGFGKTVLGYLAAYTAQCKTLVITTKDDIYKQWIDGACGLNGSPNFLGLDPSEVGEIRGDKCEVNGTKFVVAMIHSLSKDGKYPDWITKGFGLVIFDECHRVPAEQFSAVVGMFPAKIRMGLSATPDRSDGKELMLYAHIGPIRAKTEGELMIPKVLRFTSSWECPRVFRSDPETGQKRLIRLPHEPGKTTHLEKMMAADSVRNHMIADLILSAFEKDRKLVVFSTLHEHLKALHRAVQDLGVSGRNMGFYIGATTKADKAAREKVKVKPIIFTTYSMMSEGTNIPWVDTCILAIPRSNVTQPVGRIRREYEDKGLPVVMDIVDRDSPVFSSYADSREKWYQRIGAVVKDMTE